MLIILICNRISNIFTFLIQSGDQEVLIEDETGKSLPAMVVFSESLSYLKQSVIDCVSKQLIGIELTDIKWIVTVPAIWSDPAKAFMRKAALEVFVCSMTYLTDIFRYLPHTLSFSNEK